MEQGKGRYWYEKGVNAAVASFYAWFAWIHGTDFLATGRGSSLLLLIYETMIVGFALFRAMPKDTSSSTYDWGIAVAGTALPLLLRPAPELHESALFQVLQFTGTAISMTALLSLNRSFGIVPANRTIRTGGLYRFIRHPMYAGYFLSLIGFSVQNPTGGNIAVSAGFMALSILRIRAEEQFLARDAGYAAYMDKTRWRLFPFVW